MEYVLALDAGGTKTLAAMADASGAVTSLQAGPSLDPTAQENWQDLFLEMVAPALQKPGLKAAVAGLPFHDELLALSARQSELASQALPCSVLVQNDVRIAFDGAFAGAAGVLVLSGTGSMAWASLNGTNDPHYRIGGWGDGFGDEGSAFWIGRESLALASMALDGRSDATPFAHGLLAEMGLAEHQLIDWVYGVENRRSSIAAIARVTAGLADQGVSDAREILDRACDCLAAHVSAAQRRLNAGSSLPWSYAGGVFANAYVLNGVCDRVGSRPVSPVLPPVGGAVLRAAQLAGWNTDKAFIEGLSMSLNEAFQSI